MVGGYTGKTLVVKADVSKRDEVKEFNILITGVGGRGGENENRRCFTYYAQKI